jgi:hypothetical protein
MKRIMLSCVAVLALMGETQAGITYTNASKKPIDIAVITTFNSNIYRDGWVRINPGTSYRIGKGAFNPDDTYWVMVKVDGKDYEFWTPTGTKYAAMESSTAYMPRSGTNFGQLTRNKAMATGMREGHWSSFRREYGGTKFNATKVTPRTRERLDNATLTFDGVSVTFTP